MTDRLPPHSLEAEMALLGALMVDREFVPAAAAIVRPGDCYGPVHETIYRAILALFDAGEPCDMIAVATRLQSERFGAHDRLADVGGLPYLRSLLDSIQTASSVEYYAKLVAEKAVLRRLIGAGRRIYELGFAGEDDAQGAISEADAVLRQAVAGSERQRGTSLAAAVQETFRELDAAVNGTRRPGYSSPWPMLDDMTGRSFPGELFVWGAAPQAGKSIAVAQVAMHLARHHGQVALFALEMGVKDTVRRMVARSAGISSRRLRLGQVHGTEWDRIGEAIGELSALPVWIFDRFPRTSVDDIRRAVARLRVATPVVAVMIDHANFLADANLSVRMSKHERLDRVYQELLSIASEHECVMHVVQHLNREGMQGEPTLGSLRDGGNLEGHAHVVVFPYRADIVRNPTVGEFIVAKNRDGQVAKLPMTFDGARLEWREAERLEGVA